MNDASTDREVMQLFLADFEKLKTQPTDANFLHFGALLQLFINDYLRLLEKQS